MKKTIIASAIAAVVAAPAAFADVSISGQINVEFSDREGSDATGNNHTDVVLSGSEDLGNGMKAGFVWHMVSDGDGGTTAESFSVGGDKRIDLSGDFGTISAGRMEALIENKIASVANIDASEELDLEFNPSGDINYGRDAAGLRYTSPNMNGLTFGVEAFADEGDTTNDWDMTAVYAKYSANGLTVQVAQENSDSTNNGDTTAFSIQYTMGDIALRAVNMDLDATTTADDAEATVVGATYTMGNNEFAIASTVDASGAVSATEGDTIYSAKHSLSKSTSVYLVHFADDTGNADETVVGVKHSF
jgi:predicted porin